jgi:hypothetical protein
MKKHLLLFLLFISIFSYAQHSWSPVGDQPNGTVYSLAADTGGVLYLGGSFTMIGIDSISGIGRWSDNKFSRVGTKGITGSLVSSVIVYDRGIVAGGNFTGIDTITCNNIAYWDGAKWDPMVNGLDYTGATTVSTLIIYDDELYAGGTFITSGSDTLNNIARWDGEEWHPLGTGINGSVKTLCVYDGELYAAGTFTNAGGVAVNNIAKWNGSTWSDVGGGLEYTGATTVSTLKVYNDNLYAGGIFNIAGGDTAMHLAKWDGSDWSDVGSGLEYTGATTVSTFTLHEFDGKLIAEAKYRDISDTTLFTYQMQYWNDTAWSIMDSETDLPVYAMTTVNGSLFAGGTFTSIATDSVSFLAQWATSGERSMLREDAKDQLHEEASAVLYPNPVVDGFNINLIEIENIKGNYILIISDILGREILKTTIYDGYRFYRSTEKAGAYFYNIRELNGNSIQKGKVIFE